MNTLSYIPVSEFARLRAQISDPCARCEAVADALRINILHMIQMAGSGHIGTSFSCIDILTWLYQEILAEGDVCFSSKGHDAPALYALLISLGRLPEDQLHCLRRLGGLPGHPDRGTPGILTNTGSLGMGISKARGFALARRLKGVSGRQLYVILGDGELQEGQFWESLQPTANGRYSEITAIVDHNKLQSDWRVSEVSDLGDLEQKIAAFGWLVDRCDGHDVAQFSGRLAALAQSGRTAGKPQLLIADTVKGKGVSFMESASLPPRTLYAFHSGAPAYELHEKALAEVSERLNTKLAKLGVAPLELASTPGKARYSPQQPQKLVKAYGEKLVHLAASNPRLVALDGDLMLDTGLVEFQKRFPDRFVECGIAEQDMVSMAGALAAEGMLPLVHSFSCFLSARPNEQIYNNGTEHTKVIYAGSLAGLLPAAPGHSHQAVRDISSLGDVPDLVLLEPCCEKEVDLALEWAVNANPQSTYLRLVTLPVDVEFELPDGYSMHIGRGCRISDGNEIICFAYGPWLLNETVKAAKLLAQDRCSVCVYNFPWLNRFDAAWLKEVTAPFRMIVTLDNHYVAGGQGSRMIAELASAGGLEGKQILQLGVRQVPACGQPWEILDHHGLSAGKIAGTLRRALAGRA